MAETVNPPEGFTLDDPKSSLPEGFSIDQQSKQPDTKANLLLGTAGLGTAAMGGAAIYGATKAYKALSPQRTKLAGDLINSIIKPRHKEFTFGKNPGKGVAQEGIAGLNLGSIGQKVDKRLNELNSLSKGIRSLEENKVKNVNLEKALDPFYEAMEELGKAPETHKLKINDIDMMVKDLEGNLPKDINIKEVPLEIAHGIKKVVTSMQKWGGESTGDNILNSALKKVYHNIDSSIDSTIPALKEVNSRIANLISAQQAIRNRGEVLSRHEFNIGDVANLPLKLFTSTATRSGVAKLLSEKFGMVARKGASGIMAFAPVLDAIRYSQDPEAYMYQMETGNQLSPNGSFEREVETGRVI